MTRPRLVTDLDDQTRLDPAVSEALTDASHAERFAQIYARPSSLCERVRPPRSRSATEN